MKLGFDYGRVHYFPRQTGLRLQDPSSMITMITEIKRFRYSMAVFASTDQIGLNVLTALEKESTSTALLNPVFNDILLEPISNRFTGSFKTDSKREKK